MKCKSALAAVLLLVLGMLSLPHAGAQPKEPTARTLAGKAPVLAPAPSLMAVGFQIENVYLEASIDVPSQTVLTHPNVPATTGSNVVDWVEVELRAANDIDKVVSVQPAILLSDGRVQNALGGLVFDFDVADGDYFVAIAHRNHLGYATGVLQTLSMGTMPTVDFRAGVFNAFAKDLIVNGQVIRAMIAGDADNDGDVDAADRSRVWDDRNTAGYLLSDVTFDGVVNAADRSMAWNNRNLTQPYN